MKKGYDLTRRNFLYVSAVAAGGAMLAACGGEGGTTPAPGGATTVSESPATGEPTAPALSPVEPTTPPIQDVGKQATAAVVAEGTEFKQAPMLDEMADLPPIAERLPKKPYVVPHEWVKQGKYGGHLRMVSSDVWGTAHFLLESMYGWSPLRWLRDGLEIGPGIAESWESNDDLTEWTLNFREGLKWSDGQPWTTEDVMFWWEDAIQDEEHPSSPPTELKSATGKPATIRAVNDTTVTMTYDVPQPLFADYLACWVKGWIPGDASFAISLPKHYLQQFHPKYNTKLKNKKGWVDDFQSKADPGQNPDMSTLNGWMLQSYREGRQSEWTRNPYYYAVTKQGDQLPYIDTVTYNYVQNPEVMRLRIGNGEVDYVYGPHTGLNLQDVSQMRRAGDRAGTVVDFWDSGSGTGSIFFFNMDYEEEAYREAFRDKRLRQAISHAFNRDEVQRAVYFNQGEKTTGTLSPKAVEYRFNAEARQRYLEWRDSYIEYDPEKANQLLDEAGFKKSGQFRTLPNGRPFKLRLEIQANQPSNGEHYRKNQLLARDLQAVGINTMINPVPQDSFGERFANGKLHTTTAWGVGDGPNHLAYPEWIVPQETSRWAPLQGRYLSQIRGTPAEKEDANKNPWKRTPPWIKPEEGSPVDRLYEIYQRARQEPDTIKRHQMVWEMIRVHVEEGPFFMGCVANSPQLIIRKNTLMNVSTGEQLRQYAQGGWAGPWILPAPAVYDPEAYYWDDPETHQKV